MDNELLTEPNWFKRNWKWLTPIAVIGLFGVFVIAYASTGLKSKPESEIAFDSAKWQIKKGLDHPYRLNMLSDLMKSDTLKTLKKEEIITLLGPPNQIDDVYIFYTVAQKRIGLFPINTKSLVIKLAKDGTKNKVMTHG